VGRKHAHWSNMTRNVCRRFTWRQSIAFCKLIGTILLPMIPSQSRCTGCGWLQTCHFGLFGTFCWRNTGSYCLTACYQCHKWKSPCSRLEASSRSTTENMTTTSHRGSRLWHWSDLVASPWSFYVEIAMTLAGQAEQWVNKEIGMNNQNRVAKIKINEHTNIL